MPVWEGRGGGYSQNELLSMYIGRAPNIKVWFLSEWWWWWVGIEDDFLLPNKTDRALVRYFSKTPLEGKEISFHRRGLQLDTSSAEEATLLCGNTVHSFLQSCTYAMIGLYWCQRNHCWLDIVFFL